MEFPKISVIIPTYNRDEYLRNAIQSVLNQTYQNFEIIVVDDVSTSVDTVAVVNNILDNRIILVKNEVNSGPAFSRNHGIEMAKGDFISFLDSDDFFLPTFLENSLAGLETTSNDGVGFFWVGYRTINDEGQTLKEVAWSPDLNANPYQTFLRELRIGSGCGLTFRREVLNKVKFNPKLRAAEDTEFLLRVSQAYRYAYTNKVLIVIRKHTEERVTSNLKETLYAYLKILDFHKKAIYSNSDLKRSYLDKLMSLSFKVGKRKLGRTFFKMALPASLFSVRFLAKWIVFELKGVKG